MGRHVCYCGPGSVVGIAKGYGLNGPGTESRWGARFSAPVQTGPGAHPASCTMGTGSFPGVKSGRVVMLTTHPLLVPWSNYSRAIPLLPLWAVQNLSAFARVHFTLPYLPFPSLTLTYLTFLTRMHLLVVMTICVTYPASPEQGQSCSH